MYLVMIHSSLKRLQQHEVGVPVSTIHTDSYTLWVEVGFGAASRVGPSNRGSGSGPLPRTCPRESKMKARDAGQASVRKDHLRLTLNVVSCLYAMLALYHSVCHMGVSKFGDPFCGCPSDKSPNVWGLHSDP